MKCDYLIKDKILYKKTHTFDFEVKKHECFNGNILILFKVHDGEKHNENLILLNSNFEIIWKVEKIEYVYEDSPYEDFEVENEIVKGYNYDSHVYFIDIKTGKIIGKEFFK